MSDTTPTTGPVTWVKHKYTAPKDKGRYKGGANASAKGARKRKKVGGGPSPIEHVRVLRFTGFTYPEGSTTAKWITRPRETGRR